MSCPLQVPSSKRGGSSQKSSSVWAPGRPARHVSTGGRVSQRLAWGMVLEAACRSRFPLYSLVEEGADEARETADSMGGGFHTHTGIATPGVECLWGGEVSRLGWLVTCFVGLACMTGVLSCERMALCKVLEAWRSCSFIVVVDPLPQPLVIDPLPQQFSSSFQQILGAVRLVSSSVDNSAWAPKRSCRVVAQLREIALRPLSTRLQQLCFNPCCCGQRAEPLP